MPTTPKSTKTFDPPLSPTLNLVAWFMAIALQIASGYGLFYLLRVLFVSPLINTSRQFILILVIMGLSFTLGAWLLGLAGLLLRRQKPLLAGKRLLTSLIGASIPVLLLAYLGHTIGFSNLAQFEEIVVQRMIPYYSNLCMIFSIAGFYVNEWFSRVVKPKPTQTSSTKK